MLHQALPSSVAGRDPRARGSQARARGAGLHGAQGRGERRAEVPSSPLPPAASGPGRLHPPHPARPPGRPAAHRPGRRGLGAPPPPGPTGRWEGARSKRALLPPEWAAAPGGRGSSSPSHPLPPLSTCGGPGQEEAAHGPGRRQLSVRSPAGRGGRARGGAGRQGGGHSAPPAGESCVERRRKRSRRHSRHACVVAQGGPAPFRPALLRESQDLAPPPARRPRVLRGLMMSSVCGLL